MKKKTKVNIKAKAKRIYKYAPQYSNPKLLIMDEDQFAKMIKEFKAAFPGDPPVELDFTDVTDIMGKESN